MADEREIQNAFDAARNSGGKPEYLILPGRGLVRGTSREALEWAASAAFAGDGWANGPQEWAFTEELLARWADL